MRIEIGSAYTLVFFIVILPMLWGMQALARWIENTHGTSLVQRG
jgi:putative spermidine/putrescine transport system permease protein